MLFLLIFSRLFLVIFFLLAKLFSHISCKNPLKPINIYHIFCIPKYFSLPAWWKNIREFPAIGKNQNYWGDGGQILEGCIPHPPGICSPGKENTCYPFNTDVSYIMYMIHHGFLIIKKYQGPRHGYGALGALFLGG